MPNQPIPPNAGAKKEAVPEQSEVATPAQNSAPVAIPELANLPTPTAPVETPKETAAATPEKPATTTTDTAAAPALPPAPTTTAPEAGDQPGTDTAAAGGNTLPPLTVAAPPSTLPGLNLPQPPAGVGVYQATTLPEVGVDAPAKPKLGGRTWMTKLAPAIVPVNTNFNYKRQILPDVIYRKQYDRDNAHLPIAVTREDYARLLMERVAANDINGTRALLNTGLPVNMVDGYGQTLLNVARQYGARDTERLLIARGAS